MNRTISWWRAGILAIGLLGGIAPVCAQGGGKTAHIIVAFAPGGSSDLVARLLAQHLGEKTGNQVVVENRPGGGGAIAMELVARSAPDGSTLYFGSDSYILLPLGRKDLTFDPSAFVPLARIRSSAVFIAVNAKVPVNTVAELIALARSRPGTLRYASGGTGSILHLAGELFKLQTGTDIEHIPYKGSALAINDTVGGQVEMVFGGAAELQKFSGQLKVLAMTGERRSSSLPAVPTMIESGYPGMIVANWNGILAPPGMPPALADRTADDIAAAATSPEFLKRGAAMDIDPGAMLKRAEFAAFLKATTDRYRNTIEKAKIKLDN